MFFVIKNNKSNNAESNNSSVNSSEKILIDNNKWGTKEPIYYNDSRYDTLLSLNIYGTYSCYIPKSANLNELDEERKARVEEAIINTITESVKEKEKSGVTHTDLQINLVDNFASKVNSKLNNTDIEVVSLVVQDIRLTDDSLNYVKEYERNLIMKKIEEQTKE